MIGRREKALAPLEVFLTSTIKVKGMPMDLATSVMAVSMEGGHNTAEAHVLDAVGKATVCHGSSKCTSDARTVIS